MAVTLTDDGHHWKYSDRTERPFLSDLGPRTVRVLRVLRRQDPVPVTGRSIDAAVVGAVSLPPLTLPPHVPVRFQLVSARQKRATASDLPGVWPVARLGKEVANRAAHDPVGVVVVVEDLGDRGERLLRAAVLSHCAPHPEARTRPAVGTGRRCCPARRGRTRRIRLRSRPR